MQLHELTVREGINLAYYHIVSDMRDEDRQARMQGHQFEEDLNERIQRFEEKIGLRPAHEDLALWMHKHVLLPARGYSEDEIAAMFGEDNTVGVQLPAGVSEEDRWRFEDYEWDGLADFQGNPWELPGMRQQRLQKAAEEQERQKDERRDTLG